MPASLIETVQFISTYCRRRDVHAGGGCFGEFAPRRHDDFEPQLKEILAALEPAQIIAGGSYSLRVIRAAWIRGSAAAAPGGNPARCGAHGVAQVQGESAEMPERLAKMKVGWPNWRRVRPEALRQRESKAAATGRNAPRSSLRRAGRPRRISPKRVTASMQSLALGGGAFAIALHR